MQDNRITIVIAEASPIISSGLSICLKQLPNLQVNTIVVTDNRRLIEAVKNYRPGLIIANPSFNGAFFPDQLRNIAENTTPKFIALSMVPLDSHTRNLYDDVISIVDDLENINKIIVNVCNPTKEEDSEKETLSQREKEIITLVVKGFTNKEIADRLFLSIHTVNTHRRNIARKLEIHSATGLTIYAIVNHLVDLSDIKI